MSDTEPIRLLRGIKPSPRERSSPARVTPSPSTQVSAKPAPPVVAFNRKELDTILNVYSRNVAAGEWRDYALDMGQDKACFAIFQRASEYPIYRIEKCPKLARKQGAFSVIARTGAILKRGHDLKQVLSVLQKPKVVRV